MRRLIKLLYCGLCKLVFKIPGCYDFLKSRDFPLCIYKDEECELRG